MAEPRDALWRPASASPIPWLGVLLALVCAGYSILGQIEATEIEARRDQAYASASAYFLEHPYLEPDAALMALVEPGERVRSRETFQAERRSTGFLGVLPRIREHRQEKLDVMLADAVQSVGESPARAVGVLPSEGFSVKWIAYPLLHLSHWHLLGNVLLLLFLAVYLEPALGRLGFVATAGGAALAGALAYGLALPSHDATALIGASPLLAGLWLVFAVRHRRRTGEGFYEVGLVLGALWLWLPPWFGVRWSLAELTPFASAAVVPAHGVYWSFLGAALVGGVAALASAGLAAAPPGPSRLGPPGSGHPLYRRALRSREERRPREALEDLQALLATEPESLEAALLAWDLARELGRNHEATGALIRVIQIQLRRGQTGDAVENWDRLTVPGIPLEAEPRFLLGMSLALRECGRERDSSFALRCSLERSEDEDSRALAASIARAAHGLAPEIVEAAAWRALGSIELTLAERQALENLIAEVLSQRKAAAPTQPVEPRTPTPRSDLLPEDLTEAEPEELFYVEVAPGFASFRGLEAVEAVPVGLGDEGLDIQTSDGQTKLVRWERIEAVALAAVEGLAEKPLLLLDLALNWVAPEGQVLRVIRLRSDHYDPRRLMGREGSRVEALRELIETLLERSQAAPLPSEEAVSGRPFASYPSLADYERGVLEAESRED